MRKNSLPDVFFETPPLASLSPVRNLPATSMKLLFNLQNQRLTLPKSINAPEDRLSIEVTKQALRNWYKN